MFNSGYYKMDCMQGMKSIPDKFIDLAIVDPPYGIGLDFVVNNGIRESIHKKTSWNDVSPNKEYFDELYRVSKHQIIWGCNYFGDNIKSVGRIIHNKKLNISGTKLKYSEADIASCSLQKRVTMFDYRWAGNLQGGKLNWKNEGLDSRIHPTQKPVILYRWILKNYAHQGWKLLDTHVGSASSLIGFEIEGFTDYWGFEIDDDYYKNSLSRLNAWKKSQTINLFAGINFD